MRIALLLLTAFIGGAAAAQEASAPATLPAAPPAVSTEAPALSGAPSEEAAPPAAPVAEQATGAATGAPAALPTAGNEGTPAPAATTEGTAPAAPATVAGGDQPGTDPAAPATAEAAPAATGSAPAAPAPVEAASEEAPINLAAMHADLLPLFMDAHWVVKAVMVGLAIAAFAALTILVHKLAEYALAFGKLSRTARLLQSAPDLATAAAGAAKLRGPAADMLRSAEEEMRLALREPALLPGVHARTESALSRIDAGAAQRLRSATGILASIGSLSPFVGLFGTVFGIMNSFLAIAETKTTNLAVVAPGIAEALLATAIGLAAAIPAVLIYNICTRKLAKYRHRLGDVASGVLRLQSREIDRFAATLSERG